MTKFNCSFRIHSRRHLEFKSLYPLASDKSHVKFDMDYYFYFPAQLRMNSSTTTSESFLKKTQTNIRFHSPQLSFQEVVDPQNDKSPLFRIKKMIDDPSLMENSNHDPLIYELQTLTNIFRSGIKGFFTIIEEIQNSANGIQSIEQRFPSYIEELKEALKETRNLHSLFLNTRVSDKQRTGLIWADESIAMIYKYSLTRMFEIVEKWPENSAILNIIEKELKSEDQYYESMGFHSYDNENPHSAEKLAYRESILKKWSQSALYMSSENSSAPRRMNQLFASIAAGIAMSGAVYITFYAELLFAKNSLPWIILIIFAYIFKDRIKDNLGESFHRLFPGLTRDQVKKLVDPASKKRAGISKGGVSFMKSKGIPSFIHQYRYTQYNDFREILPEEDVIRFSRSVKLQAKKLKSKHTRLDGVTEILRIRIDDWLKEMDDPKGQVAQVLNGKITHHRENRVYRIHLIIHMKEGGSSSEVNLHHYRIVMNKTGIKRIEEVS